MPPAKRVRCMKRHAKVRATQRYDVALSDDDIQNIIKKIQANQGTHLWTQSNSRSIWKVEYEGKEYKLVYDKSRKQVITFLPQDAFTY